MTDCEQARRSHGNRNARRYNMYIGREALHHPQPAMDTFQVICLNKNGDSVKVFRQKGSDLAAVKEAVRLRFAFQGAPAGATTFRVVPLH